MRGNILYIAVGLLLHEVVFGFLTTSNHRLSSVRTSHDPNSTYHAELDTYLITRNYNYLSDTHFKECAKQRGVLKTCN